MPKTPKKTKLAKNKATKESPAAKKAKPQLSDRRERFAAEMIRSGGKRARSAVAAGYSPRGARQTAHRLLTNVDVQERIQRAKQRAGITPEVVSGVLAQQLLGDVADLLNDDGEFDYELAKHRGVTGQIKKLKIKTSQSSIIDKDGEPLWRAKTVDLELYSAQDAAKILVGTLGMLKQPAVNPEDVARVKAEIDRLIAEGWPEEDAKAIVIEAEPRAAQWIA